MDAFEETVAEGEDVLFLYWFIVSMRRWRIEDGLIQDSEEMVPLLSKDAVCHVRIHTWGWCMTYLVSMSVFNH